MTKNNLSLKENQEPTGMNRESFRKLAEVSKMSLDELRGQIGFTGIDENARPVRATIHKLPIYRMLPASKLGGPEDMYTVPQVPDEYEDLPAPSAECAVIQIDGTCMEPDYPSGCYVMVDFGRTAGEGLVPGAAYYVQLRGEVGEDGKSTFKRYVGPDGDAEVFDCINKADYPDPIPLRGLFNVAIAVAKVDWMAGKR